MTTLQAIIPDDIHGAVLAQAGREPIRALVSRTLRAAVALPQTRGKGGHHLRAGTALRFPRLTPRRTPAAISQFRKSFWCAKLMQR